MFWRPLDPKGKLMSTTSPQRRLLHFCLLYHDGTFRNDLYCVGWGIKLYSLTRRQQPKSPTNINMSTLRIVAGLTSPDLRKPVQTAHSLVHSRLSVIISSHVIRLYQALNSQRNKRCKQFYRAAQLSKALTTRNHHWIVLKTVIEIRFFINFECKMSNWIW